MPRGVCRTQRAYKQDERAAQTRTVRLGNPGCYAFRSFNDVPGALQPWAFEDALLHPDVLVACWVRDLWEEIRTQRVNNEVALSSTFYWCVRWCLEGRGTPDAIIATTRLTAKDKHDAIDRLVGLPVHGDADFSLPRKPRWT